ncbi:MAG TPA: type II toxin-antitoxin system VapC family toxin [Candidatus Hydrogenedentes bacterium]|nr:type II toxin-antitoxin system VapC family toxin [Candidatus Hydrogenedentota bacterium]
MKPSVYLETTIISYLAARPSRDSIISGHQVATHLWWESYRERYALFCSTLVIEEGEAGDLDAATRRLSYLKNVPKLAVTDTAKGLAQIMIDVAVVPQGYPQDALHIAICAVHNIDFLLTWNCRHLANAMTRKRIENIVQAQGYCCPVICTPEELMEDENV